LSFGNPALHILGVQIAESRLDGVLIALPLPSRAAVAQHQQERPEDAGQEQNLTLIHLSSRTQHTLGLTLFSAFRGKGQGVGDK
jgi:hypothetical protein